MDLISILSLIFGAVGVAFGIHGYFSSKALSNKLLDEKDLIADKIKDFRSEWVHKQKMIQNESEQRPDELVNMYLWKLRIEEVEKNIEVLDRFIERLEKTK